MKDLITKEQAYRIAEQGIEWSIADEIAEMERIGLDTTSYYNYMNTLRDENGNEDEIEESWLQIESLEFCQEQLGIKEIMKKAYKEYRQNN